MNNFRYKMAQSFSGRTGVDALGRTVTWVALILMLLTTFTHSNTIYLLSMACLAYSVWRMLSKNYQKRYNENQLFLQKTVKILIKEKPTRYLNVLPASRNLEHQEAEER